MGGIDAVRSKRGGKKRARETGPSLDPLPIAQEVIVEQGVELDGEQKTKKTRRGKRGGRSAIPLDDVADVLPPSATSDQHLENPERKRRREHDDETTNRRPFFADNAISAEPELDVETRSYFESIEKVLDEQSYDDLSVLLANTYKEIDGKEVLITKDYSTSRILEKILQVSTDFQIRVFMERLSGQFLDLYQHQFSSHVCQTLLNLGADIAERELKGESVVELVSGVNNQLPSMEALIVTACQELDGSWVMLMKHRYACHILRTALLVLSGESMEEQKLKSKRSLKYNSNHQLSSSKFKGARAVSQSFMKCFEGISSDIMAFLGPSEFKALSIHPIANPVLQLLISFPKFTDSVICRIMADDKGSFLKFLIQDSVGSHLMEKILRNLSPEQFKAIFDAFFCDHLLEYSEHHVANFVIQHLIINCADDAILAQIHDEIAPSLEQLYFQNRAGVVAKLFEAGIKAKSLQGPLTKSLMTSFHVDTPAARKELIRMIVFMRSSQQLQGLAYDPRPQVQGALILQYILSYEEKHHTLITEGLFALSPEALLKWARDPVCSRVLEQFFVSSVVTLKSKRKLLRGLTHHFGDLAKDKYASHLIDKCWRVSSLELKELIAGELAAQDRALSDNTYGRFALRNCKIDLFKRRRDEWKQIETGVEKKKDFFKDLF